MPAPKYPTNKKKPDYSWLYTTPQISQDIVDRYTGRRAVYLQYFYKNYLDPKPLESLP